MAQWDSNATMTNVNSQGASPSSLFQICKNKVETPNIDARLHEGIALPNEQQSSANFVKAFGNKINFDRLLRIMLFPRWW